MTVSLSRLPLAAVLSGALLSFVMPAFAQDKPKDATDKKPEIVLTAEEVKEKELRKSCKIALCSAFHVRKPTDGDVACGVLKTWRKEQLTKMVSKGGVSWPWVAVTAVSFCWTSATRPTRPSAVDFT